MQNQGRVFELQEPAVLSTYSATVVGEASRQLTADTTQGYVTSELDCCCKEDVGRRHDAVVVGVDVANDGVLLASGGADGADCGLL